MDKKINLLAPINELGYGIAGKNIAKALHEYGYDVSLFVIGQPNFSSQEEADYFSGMLKAAKFFDNKAPCLKVWHEFSMAERVGNGRFIGFPFFELDKFDDVRVHNLSSCDDIIVASQWAKEIVEKEVEGSKVHIAHLGVDRNIFKNIDNATGCPPSEKLIFFNCGKWEKRKGHDIILPLFQYAFPEESNVELWMMCENPFLSPENSRAWVSSYSSDPRVRLIPRVRTQKELAGIMSNVHCGLFPSRAEGWNLEIPELMSMGKHIIATNYSAHKEYCNSKNSILIDIKKKEPAVDNIWFHGEGEWASLEGTEELIVDSMKSIYNRFVNGKFEINAEGIKTAEEFSWTKTATMIDEVLNG